MSRAKKTLDQIAREEDEKVAQGREAEGYVRIEANIADEVGHIMMIWFTADELALIGERARVKGLLVRDYVREAFLGTTATDQESSKSA